VVAAWSGLVASSAARADDVIVYRNIGTLRIVEGTLPSGAQAGPTAGRAPLWATRPQMQQIAYVVLDGPGEAYLDQPRPQGVGARDQWLNRILAPIIRPSASDILAVRVPARPGKSEVEGRLFVPGEKGMVGVRFILSLTPTTPEAVAAFADAKWRHYEDLLRHGGPGAPWFRHQVRDAMARMPEQGAGGGQLLSTWPPFNLASGVNSLNDTYSLFSGGRAISENLQFDRPLGPNRPGGFTPPSPVPGPNQPRPVTPPPVKVATLPGISVAEFDWSAKLAGRNPCLDPLARAIPADQHALFLAGLAEAQSLLAEFQGTAIPILETSDAAAEVVPVQSRYERQLAVSVADLSGFQSHFSGPARIKSLAVTGSDPYFATGTDIALLLQVDEPGPLISFLKERLAAACAASSQEVQVVEEQRNGVQSWMARTPDRSLSSYIAALEGMVLLTNSPWQVDQVSGTLRGRHPRLADALEYHFFRARYPRDEAGETGLVVLTDATIRRWCGARWRIGSSRRVRVGSLLASVQTDHLEDVLAGRELPGTIQHAQPMQGDFPDPGPLRLTRTGVVSEVYGSLLFPTPIAEIPLDEVTWNEADAYNFWRQGYQNNWRAYFDPIAIRLGVQPGRRLAADLTVMPLIAGSNYRSLIELSGSSRIAPGDGDPHPGTLLHAILAIDIESSLMRLGGNQVWLMMRIPQHLALSWIGHSAAVYFDADPFWAEVAKQPDPSSYLWQHMDRLPVGFHIKVTDGTKLALFLGALRAFLEQSSPDLLAYELREHNGQRYVRVGERRRQQSGDVPTGSRFSLYYAATPQALVASPNEGVVTRFLDRQAGAESPGGSRSESPAAAPDLAWLGESLALRTSREGLQVIGRTAVTAYREVLQQRSWANLPILNEYRRLFPDRDPVQVHEQLWGVRLTCPAGGRYAWNEKWRTMESTAFGCPAAPKAGPAGLEPLRDFKLGRLGLTFEDQGLRARVAIDLAKGL